MKRFNHITRVAGKGGLSRAGAVLLALVVSMTQPLMAQKVDRSKQPQPDPPPKVAFPAYETFTLKNGLKVFYVRDERPLVTFRLMFRGGNNRDGDIVGLSDAAADLLTRGSGSMSSQEYAQKIDFVGGSVSTSVSVDATNVVASGLKKHVGTILDLFATAVKKPTYNQQELEKYKQEAITSIQSAKANAGYLATAAVNKVLYGATPYGRVQTEEDVAKLNQANIRQWHDTYLVPNNATLAFVGDISKEELKSMLEKAFADWKSAKVPAMKAFKFPERKGRRIILVDRPASVQSSIRVLGFGPRFNDPERPKASVLNSIFGGGTGLGNRLAINLRETHAYTYTPGSYFDANDQMGTFIALADVRNAVTDSAVGEILHEINRIQTEPVPQEELTRNIQSATGQFLMSIADPSITAQRLQFIDFYGLPKDYYNRLTSIYGSTSQSDVQRLAKKYMDNDNLAIVVVGKADEVRAGLERFGKVEVWDADMNPVGGNEVAAGGASAEDVWGKMLQAMGGKAMREAQSVKMSGGVAISAQGQSFAGTMTRIQATPSRMYAKVDAGPFQQEIWVNEKGGVMHAFGQRQELKGEELESQLFQAQLFPEARLSEHRGVIKMKGRKKVSGKDVYQVSVTYPKGGTKILSIDANTFLPVMEEEETGQSQAYDNWQRVNGIMFPGTITITPQPGVSIVISEIKVDVNEKYDDATFAAK